MMQALFKDKMGDLQKLTGGNIKAGAAGFAGEGDIVAAVQVLERAAETKTEDPEAVLTQLLALEKLMRARNAFDGDATSRETFEMLDGSWRLIFTTGTIDTQKKIGKINYFPIKAVQSFDTTQMKISNGIFLGDFALLKFFGPWSWVSKVRGTAETNSILRLSTHLSLSSNPFSTPMQARRLVFDFDEIAVLGVRISLPKGGAAKIGSQTGLGSDNNVALAEKGQQPFFNWVLANENIAVARGGGGGLALWRRDLEEQERAKAAL